MRDVRIKRESYWMRNTEWGMLGEIRRKCWMRDARRDKRDKEGRRGKCWMRDVHMKRESYWMRDTDWDMLGEIRGMKRDEEGRSGKYWKAEV